MPVVQPETRVAGVPERVVRLVMCRSRCPPPPQEPAPLVATRSQELAEKTVPEAAKPKERPGQGPGRGPAAGPGKGMLAFREQLSGLKAESGALAARLPARVTVRARQRRRSALDGERLGAGLERRHQPRRPLAAASTGEVEEAAAGAIAASRSRARPAHRGRRRRRLGGKGGGGGRCAGRTDEEIQIVFDRHKSELYRLYNRELRRDPTLRGQMILRLRIEPDGSVTLCELRGTDMRAPELAAQVVARVRAFDFGAKEGIGPVTILYPIDFLPAG